MKRCAEYVDAADIRKHFHLAVGQLLPVDALTGHPASRHSGWIQADHVIDAHPIHVPS